MSRQVKMRRSVAKRCAPKAVPARPKSSATASALSAPIQMADQWMCQR